MAKARITAEILIQIWQDASQKLMSCITRTNNISCLMKMVEYLFQLQSKMMSSPSAEHLSGKDRTPERTYLILPGGNHPAACARMVLFGRYKTERNGVGIGGKDPLPR